LYRPLKRRHGCREYGEYHHNSEKHDGGAVIVARGAEKTKPLHEVHHAQSNSLIPPSPLARKAARQRSTVPGSLTPLLKAG